MRRLLACALLSVALVLPASSDSSGSPFSVVAVARAQTAPPTGGSTPAPAGPAAEGATTTAPAMDAGTFAVRLRDLEQRINELKEQVFRSKGRLALLAETVLEGTVGGAQLLIRHENELSSTFQAERIVYLLDGAQIFPTAQSLAGDALADADTFDVYRGAIVPGEHTLSVTVEYVGNGHGVFSYMQGIHTTYRSSRSFTAPEGRALTLRVVVLESGGPTTPLQDRPTFRYVEVVTDELGEGTTASEGAAE